VVARPGIVIASLSIPAALQLRPDRACLQVERARVGAARVGRQDQHERLAIDIIGSDLGTAGPISRHAGRELSPAACYRLCARIAPSYKSGLSHWISFMNGNLVAKIRFQAAKTATEAPGDRLCCEIVAGMTSAPSARLEVGLAYMSTSRFHGEALTPNRPRSPTFWTSQGACREVYLLVISGSRS